MKDIINGACVARLSATYHSEAFADRGAVAKNAARQSLQWPQHYMSRGDWVILDDASTVPASRDRIIVMRLESLGVRTGCHEKTCVRFAMALAACIEHQIYGAWPSHEDLYTRVTNRTVHE
jgi:hypothetical protein